LRTRWDRHSSRAYPFPHSFMRSIGTLLLKTGINKHVHESSPDELIILRRENIPHP
jgi:hypothetical protein